MTNDIDYDRVVDEAVSAELPDIQAHRNSDGEVCDCGQTPPQPGRVHERELLRRAAAMIDPDTGNATHEERLDWLAKYREVIS